MRLRWTLGLVMCAARTASACQISPYLTARVADVVSFIGTASGDTALAGPGQIKFEWESVKPRTIFGQVLRVNHLGSGSPRQLLTAAHDGAIDIVVVAWAYDTFCQPVAWDASARWIPTGTRGLYTGRLRDSADWIGGRPTVDVSKTSSMPYTGVAPRYRIVTRNPTTMAPDPALTPEQLLELYDALPLPFTRGDAGASARASSEGIFQWERDHPDFVIRYPAREILEEIRGLLRWATKTAPH
jgi:hypothetical protein